MKWDANLQKITTLLFSHFVEEKTCRVSVRLLFHTHFTIYPLCLAQGETVIRSMSKYITHMISHRQNIKSIFLKSQIRTQLCCIMCACILSFLWLCIPFPLYLIMQSDAALNYLSCSSMNRLSNIKIGDWFWATEHTSMAPAFEFPMFSPQHYTMTLSNPNSDFHIRSASSQIPKTYLSRIELGSQLFMIWNLHGTSQTFSQGHFLVRSFYGGRRHLLTPEFLSVWIVKVWVVVMILLLCHTRCLRLWISLTSFSLVAEHRGLQEY